MSSNEDRRKGLRSSLQARFGFNVLRNKEDYIRGQSSIIRQLSSLDNEVLPETTNASQRYLARIDEKLSILIAMFAERNSTKNYLNQGQVLDISEFGLSFTSPINLTLGSYLEIGLVLPSHSASALDICGWIVRILPSPDGDMRKSVFGLEFTDILTTDQDEIIQWIFKKQRDDIRRRREIV